MPRKGRTNEEIIERFSHLYSNAVAAVADVIRAFRGGEEFERDRHQGGDVVEGPRPGRAQERLQFGKHLLDWIEIGTVRRQKSELRANAFDRRANFGLLVDGQVVEDDHIAWSERGHQNLVDIRAKTEIVDRAIKDGRRRHRIDPQRGNHGAGFPVATGGVIAEPRPARAPAIAAQQIGGDAALIEEDVLPHIAEWQPLAPPAPLSGDVGTALFVGVNRFF